MSKHWMKFWITRWSNRCYPCKKAFLKSTRSQRNLQPWPTIVSCVETSSATPVRSNATSSESIRRFVTLATCATLISRQSVTLNNIWRKDMLTSNNLRSDSSSLKSWVYNYQNYTRSWTSPSRWFAPIAHTLTTTRSLWTAIFDYIRLLSTRVRCIAFIAQPQSKQWSSWSSTLEVTTIQSKLIDVSSATKLFRSTKTTCRSSKPQNRALF